MKIKTPAQYAEQQHRKGFPTKQTHVYREFVRTHKRAFHAACSEHIEQRYVKGEADKLLFLQRMFAIN
jgi:hypothetical protein